MIPIFRPWFDNAEVEAVREVLMSGWVGPGGKGRRTRSAICPLCGGTTRSISQFVLCSTSVGLKNTGYRRGRGHYHTVDLCLNQSRNFTK